MKYFSKILCTLILIFPAIVTASPLVNLNKADRFELERDLIGVTEETARAIVQYRKNNGLFESLDDVLNVNGVERDFLNINRYYLHLGEVPGAKSSS